eukprot:m.48870 g.48870  ORF g.48870 m.48870 type:complete len:606 (+) comp11067_c0_seq3:257-2074(+)
MSIPHTNTKSQHAILQESVDLFRRWVAPPQHSLAFEEETLALLQVQNPSAIPLKQTFDDAHLNSDTNVLTQRFIAFLSSDAPAGLHQWNVCSHIWELVTIFAREERLQMNPSVLALQLELTLQNLRDAITHVKSKLVTTLVRKNVIEPVTALIWHPHLQITTPTALCKQCKALFQTCVTHHLQYYWNTFFYKHGNMRAIQSSPWLFEEVAAATATMEQRNPSKTNEPAWSTEPEQLVLACINHDRQHGYPFITFLLTDTCDMAASNDLAIQMLRLLNRRSNATCHKTFTDLLNQFLEARFPLLMPPEAPKERSAVLFPTLTLSPKGTERDFCAAQPLPILKRAHCPTKPDKTPLPKPTASNSEPGIYSLRRKLHQVAHQASTPSGQGVRGPPGVSRSREMTMPPSRQRPVAALPPSHSLVVFALTLPRHKKDRGTAQTIKKLVGILANTSTSASMTTFMATQKDNGENLFRAWVSVLKLLQVLPCLTDQQRLQRMEEIRHLDKQAVLSSEGNLASKLLQLEMGFVDQLIEFVIPFEEYQRKQHKANSSSGLDQLLKVHESESLRLTCQRLKRNTTRPPSCVKFSLTRGLSYQPHLSRSKSHTRHT